MVRGNQPVNAVIFTAKNYEREFLNGASAGDSE